MELIRDVIEWIGNEAGAFIFIIGPYLLAGLVALYVLWLIIGYLRVSQVGLGEGHAPQPVVALPAAADEPRALARPRGVPYCEFDGLEYPHDAHFCTQCERDLLRDCVNCGATLRAGDASCYRCGTPTGVETFRLLS
jgi:hypothetical protein